MEANRFGLVQREADQAEREDRHASDVNDANTEEVAAERAPLSDRAPTQGTNAPQGKGKQSIGKPRKGPSKGKKAGGAASKTKGSNATPAVSAEKVGKPSEKQREMMVTYDNRRLGVLMVFTSAAFKG